jgi:hypothetical protein
MRTGLRPLRSYVHRARWAALPEVARVLGPACSDLLPRPAAGWVTAVGAYQSTCYAHFATAHGMTGTEYSTAAAGRLHGWATSARVRIRLDLGDFPKFLADGRYRNQFGTGTTKGAFAPGRRMLVEGMVLGIPADAPASERPIYGYCTGSRESHANVIKYGDVVLELRRHVNHRTSFTFGDSLDEAAMLSAHPPFCPRPLDRPKNDALDARFDFLAALEPWQATRCGYIEAQIHGPLTPADIEVVTFTLGTSPADKDRVVMQDKGIRWRRVLGNEP